MHAIILTHILRAVAWIKMPQHAVLLVLLLPFLFHTCDFCDCVLVAHMPTSKILLLENGMVTLLVKEIPRTPCRMSLEGDDHIYMDLSVDVACSVAVYGEGLAKVIPHLVERVFRNVAC